MCHEIYFSTTSDQDFTLIKMDQFVCERPDPVYAANPLSRLAYPNRWYLAGAHGGCSCGFRHLFSREPAPEFSEPEPVSEDEIGEDSEAIESTLAVYDLFAGLVAEGHHVDVFDIWSGGDVALVQTFPVSLSDVPREAFGFIEDVCFELMP